MNRLTNIALFVSVDTCFDVREHFGLQAVLRPPEQGERKAREESYSLKKCKKFEK